ncbi:hypothetical protein OCU04_004245 [Sclerotinia nivalis]|uniref:Uncharacterized protein n=1 Tax=Sclerotinia nivalis TaxID=352851 RepID=A0A9X0AQW3_9HELO|nr:hypothetical protein OCU04_004245 [Sclerotinia nivalis]
MRVWCVDLELQELHIWCIGGKRCDQGAHIDFKKVKLNAAAEAAAQAAPLQEFDLSVLPTHPALTIVDNKFIQINIEYTGIVC